MEHDEEFNVNEAKTVYGFMGVETEKQKVLQDCLEKGNEPEIEEVLKGITFTGIDLEKMLKVINIRIEKLLDADHSIGHAYFMEVINAEEPIKALEKVFYQKLIPLLQEYFYGNEEKISLIIGKDFFETTSFKDDTFADTDLEAAWQEDLDNQKIYHIKQLRGKAFRNAVVRIYETTGAL